jgi:hypothetical protein
MADALGIVARRERLPAVEGGAKMNKDIRVDLGFFEHRKTRKLIARFGLEAAWGLLRLWAFVARDRPDGSLAGMSALDIAMEMHLDGKVSHEELVAFMQSDECRWLDGDQLHDWKEHNPWAFRAPGRSDAARFSRLSQVSPADHRRLAEQGVTAITKEAYDEIVNIPRYCGEPPANRQRDPGEPPAPAPSPSLESTPSRSSEYPEWFETFWGLYPARNGKKAGKKTTHKLALILPQADRDLLLVAVRNYAASEDCRRGFSKDPERFLKNDYWRDFIDAPTTPCQPGPPAGGPARSRDGFA